MPRKSKAITEAQRRVYDFLTTFISVHNYAPSTREIQEGLGFASQTSACQHLRALAAKGYLKIEPKKARAISIIKK